jgi:hypothetical protein
MPAVESISRPVFRSPTARRCFLTVRAAADAEARAQLQRKYPTERTTYSESGHIEDPGYHWSGDERLVRVHKRLARAVLRRFRATPISTHPPAGGEDDQ